MQPNHNPLTVADLRNIANNLRNRLLARGYYSAEVLFRVGDDESFYHLAIHIEYRIGGSESTVYETIRPTYVDKIDPIFVNMTQEAVTESPHLATRLIVDAAYHWVDNQPTVQEAKQAELVRSMERAKTLAEDLGVEASVSNVLVEIMHKLASNAITHRR